MSKTTDVATIAVVGLIGAGGYLILKNKKEIGDFFGGIGDFFGGIPKGIEEGLNDFANDPTVKEIDNGLKMGATITNPLTPIKLAGSIFDTIGKSVGDFFGGFNLNFGKSKIDPSDPTPVASKDLPASSKTPLVKQGIREDTQMQTIPTVKEIRENAKEIVGGARKHTQEELEQLPTKTLTELRSQSNFIGRTFNYALSKLGL